ncbi:MAG TPA: DUF4126 family protein [Terriglobia bacterium]|nr:DUF4126 family protein [Terriglobia bacterium]
MTTLAVAFAIGMLNGLRTFTPPAVAAWATRLGWIRLQGALALMGSLPSVAFFTLMAAFELFADKMPRIPNRTSPMSLLGRGVMGALTGACIAVAGEQPLAAGGACGVAGAMAGAFAGFHARMRLVKALGAPDLYIALAEDLTCLGGALWFFSRFR